MFSLSNNTRFIVKIIFFVNLFNELINFYYDSGQFKVILILLELYSN